MDLVTGVLGELPSKLLELLKDEYKLQTTVKEQIMNLTQEMDSTHHALRRVSQVPRERLDDQVHLGTRAVREASYDMEDILDSFLVRVVGRSKETLDENKIKCLMNKIHNFFSLSKGQARDEISGVIKK
ncbi:unnamed protein product [Urochloa humidicola]